MIASRNYLRYHHSMSEVAGGGERKEPEQKTPEQRVIDFVKKLAVFEGNETDDVVRGAVLTESPVPGAILSVREIRSELPYDGVSSGRIFSIRVTLTENVQESVAADEPSGENPVTYVFGDSGQFNYEFTPAERESLINSFFLRYGLEFYGNHPELWASL